MKKFILLFALMFSIAGISNAQSYTMLSSVGNTSDTNTNAETVTLTKAITGSFAVISVQAVVTKLSGTAAGNIVLQGTVNGTNYVNLTDLCQPSANDTFTLTNVTTQSCMWTITPSKYIGYRLAFTTSGTVSARVQGTIIARK